MDTLYHATLTICFIISLDALHLNGCKKYPKVTVVQALIFGRYPNGKNCFPNEEKSGISAESSLS
jgi:hypothetical protein